MLIQVINLVSGIIVIRLLSTKEYAIYTVAYTMLGAMNILTDSGISTVVMSQGGKCWRNKKELGIILNTGLSLRKKFAVVALIVIIPIMGYFLIHNGATKTETCLVIISIIPPFLATLSGSLLEIPIKLNQDLKPFQKIQIISNIIRLIIIVLTLFFIPWAWVAIIASAIPQLWANIRIRKLTQCYAIGTAYKDKKIESTMLKVVKYILPATIYKSLSGQITIWISSIIGSTSAIAQIGALGRIAIAIKSLNVIVASIIVPRFARLDNKEIILKRFIQLQLIAIALSVIIVTIFWCVSDYILIIFGDEYSGLSTECMLIAVEGCVCILGDMAYALNSARGIILHPVISVFCQLILLIILIAILPINSLTGIILLGIGVNSFAYSMHLVNFFKELKHSAI